MDLKSIRKVLNPIKIQSLNLFKINAKYNCNFILYFHTKNSNLKLLEQMNYVRRSICYFESKLSPFITYTYMDI